MSSDPDREHQAICEALALELLILAEQRGSELGVQGYRCGVGWGPRWTGKREGLASASASVLAGPFEARAPSLAEAWPAALPTDKSGSGRTGDPTGPAAPVDGPRPWFRRGWVWGTSAGVVAAIVGGVVAGVVLSGRDRPGPTLEIDADDFIGN